MQTAHARVPDKRSGFTLIEMLVVLGIILTLAVVTVLFMPRFQERQKVPRGADLLQGWLLMARQRALLDRIVTGIRLQPSAQNTNYVTDLQYIQKPDDYAPSITNSPNSLLLSPLPNDPATIARFGPGVNLFGSATADAGNESSLIQAGDYLQLRGEGLLHRINKVIGPQLCSLDSPVQAPAGTGCPFRIIRQPRLLAGEQPLQLPQDVIIDVSPGLNGSWNVPLRQSFSSGYAYWEILFSPSGRVVGQGTGNAPIALLLRDVTQDLNTGDQTLIAIYPLAGSIASHPVAAGADPFLYLRDGRSSGL